jgi:intein/homing endonuclease
METGEKEQTGNILLEEEGDLEEMMGSDAFQAQMYDDSPPMIPDETYATLKTAVNQDGTLKEILRAKKSDFVRNLIYLDGKKFDFTGRGYLRPIYDGNFKRILLKTARQVEKCVADFTHVLCADGSRKMAKNLVVGDKLVGFDHQGRRLVDIVLGSETNGKQPCLRIEVSGGRSVSVTVNHPLRTVSGWITAENLKEGDSIAALRDTPTAESGPGWEGSPDLSWEKIVSIDDEGHLPTWALETVSQTFVADGIVNHNTTFLANNLTCTSVVMPYNKALYVSPSHTQTRQFSNEKLRPAIERSPLIKRYFQDSFVSTQVFEKGFTNGSYIFLRSAFRTADRCLADGTAIYLKDGTATKVQSVQVGAEVVSFDGSKTVTRRVIGKTQNGEKECLELTLLSGHTLRASFDHRFFTSDGVKELQEIRGKDSIPIPLGYLEEEGDPDDPLPLWVGLLLGDGSIGKNNNSSTYRCQFNNNSTVLIDVYKSLCDKLGLPYSVRERQQEEKPNYTVSVSGQQRIRDMLEPLGLLGATQFTKFIPERFFKSKSAIRAVLQGLIESDGWVTCNRKSRQVEIGFVSGSHELAKGVQRGLQSLGVYSQIQLCHPRGRQRSIYWTVKVRHVKHIKLFYERVGLISKQAKLKGAVDFIDSELDESCYGMDVPARADCAAALADKGISSHEAWTRFEISFRNNVWAGARIAQQKVYRIWEITQDARLEKWLDPSVVWVSVRSVEPIGVQNTWDLEIEGDPYFTADGIFTHNTRGISARVLCLDELQDFLTTEIPVIRECTSHYPDASDLMAGTPKSHDNPIEIYWQSTTQGEWLVPCRHCGKWNFLDETNIGPTDWYANGRLPPGPICKKCQKPINPPDGRWVEFYPENQIKGFRIPQLMVPWICGIYEQWQKLLWKRDNYPFGQFSNEVLGLSYDSASKPITRDELMEACGEFGIWNLSSPEGIRAAQAEAKRWSLTAGVDWGEGNDGSEKSPSGKIRNASYTVVTVGAYVTQKHWRMLYAKKYEGREVDPDFVVRDITRICQLLGVKLIGADWGHGWGVNNVLMRTFGPNRVAQFQYMPKLKQRMKWEPIGYRYQLQRNFILSELFFDIKHGLVQFPKWKDFEPFAKDILAIYAEYVEYRREIKYDHRPSEPDDFFHSLNYAKLMSDIMTGKSRRYTLDAVQVEGPHG